MSDTATVHRPWIRSLGTQPWGAWPPRPQALIMSGIKKGADPDIFSKSNPSPILTGAMHICAPDASDARAPNRRRQYLRTLQTLWQPCYATHLLKQLWSEAP